MTASAPLDNFQTNMQQVLNLLYSICVIQFVICLRVIRVSGMSPVT